MTVIEMIKLLNVVLEDHGNVEVYFDCPFCEKSHTPNRQVTDTVHMTADNREKK